ncbi:hypothetical protein [Candidatus Hodgkinia cicadicola]|uniref:hypothetical protein n=1 Tax=Candidatus Hodgkinia cicadicola TaxID=573658 RepID=UPI0039BF49F1
MPSPLFQCDLITMATTTSLRGPSCGLILTNKPYISKRISAYQNLNISANLFNNWSNSHGPSHDRGP